MIMTKLKPTLELIASCLIYSLIIILIDFVLILFFRQVSAQIVYSLSFVMLIEGGVGLTVGGTIVLYSPLSAKIGEVILHSKPWDAKRQREVETQAKTWIATGSILVSVALLISAF
jgi:hypothetical protein